MEKCKHSDCLNCESVDVMKGLCLLDEQFVPFDGDGCPALSESQNASSAATMKLVRKLIWECAEA